MNWTWPWAKAAHGTMNHERKSGGFVAIHAAGEARWTRRDYAALAREGFMRNPIAHRSVRLIAEAAASVPWLLYEGADERDEHPLLELLERPNQRQAGAAFLETLYGHLLISGHAYVEMVTASEARRSTLPPSVLPDISSARGEIGQAELHLLRPDRVAVVADTAGWPVALDYRGGDVAGKRRVALAVAGEGRGAALHMTLFHPLDDHYGFPPLEAALIALDTHNAAGRGTRRCSTIRRGQAARWCSRQRRAATFPTSSLSG